MKDKTDGVFPRGMRPVALKAVSEKERALACPHRHASARLLARTQRIADTKKQQAEAPAEPIGGYSGAVVFAFPLSADEVQAAQEPGGVELTSADHVEVSTGPEIGPVEAVVGEKGQAGAPAREGAAPEGEGTEGGEGVRCLIGKQASRNRFTPAGQRLRRDSGAAALRTGDAAEDDVEAE